MKGSAERVWIALGSNLGDRRANLEGALRSLDADPGIRVRRVSPWFETGPVGGPPGQPAFWNGVVEADCTLVPRELLDLLNSIEAHFGRDRSSEVRNGPRTLDLDLILYGEEEVHEPDLEVPHPRMEERTFVLEPLAHLVPGRRLARCGLTVSERLAELRATAESGG